MIQVENLSYGFPSKELYNKISFTLETGQHCAFIGSNGTGKTTLVNMIMDPEKYLYDGKIIKDSECRIGYVNQFSKAEKDLDQTVFEFLSQCFVENQAETARICDEMAIAEDLEPLLEQYQILMDLFTAMDGDHYESNIKKQLHLVGMTNRETTALSALSGGEYKLLQVMKEMLLQPNLLIMDEPDVFLDFENLNGLCKLINSYKGTILVITHNRYLLHHCFNKILHLENTDLQEFDGSYTEYNYALLQKKIELQEIVAEEQAEIARAEKMVERLRAEATRASIASLGRTVHAKQTYLDRLKTRAIKEPFVNLRTPNIVLPEVESADDSILLRVTDYRVEFDEVILDNVSFEIKAGAKVALVGGNGTGKTTLLRDLYKNNHPSITIEETANIGFLSQLHGEMLDESKTVYEEFESLGFDKKEDLINYLKDYCFEEETLSQKIGSLSGGEQNLLQLAKISVGNANLLLLDEPTSHLDTYAQIALEKAIKEYHGTVLMVSHDFYHIVNCADYILMVDENSLRPVRIRTFRKKIYENHFPKDYLEKEQQKKELEARVNACLKSKDYQTAKKLCEELMNA